MPPCRTDRKRRATDLQLRRLQNRRPVNQKRHLPNDNLLYSTLKEPVGGDNDVFEIAAALPKRPPLH